jgi:NADPH:quinone reductase-like Zn-dependent oxidoreductase
MVLIKVNATTVMPTEFEWFTTFSTPSGEARPFPIVMGHEFSGVVASMGSNVEGFGVGEEVYGLNDWFINGAQAEYCVVAGSALARKPKTIDHVRSAVVPISALTAWQGLFEKLRLEKGQSVLIHGASGGVGQFAVQMAHAHGARVVATASGANMDFVRLLGAEQVIDHRASRFEDLVTGVDAVFDAVGGEILKRSWSVLKPGGRLVTIATNSVSDTEQRVRDAFFIVRADGRQLGQIAGMIDAGEIRVFVAGIFPLSETAKAYSPGSKGRLPGKIVIRVVAEMPEAQI